MIALNPRDPFLNRKTKDTGKTSPDDLCRAQSEILVTILRRDRDLEREGVDSEQDPMLLNFSREMNRFEFTIPESFLELLSSGRGVHRCLFWAGETGDCNAKILEPRAAGQGVRRQVVDSITVSTAWFHGQILVEFHGVDSLGNRNLRGLRADPTKGSRARDR